MNHYQKVYMNQIHSSSLLGQLAQMWRSQMLCDALIRTGNITTKAHRVVLVAACPMLQSMDNASVGSHLEVRLAADIKQEAVNTFLQYLYEGFMMLTEENCKDVEKVARLLQVDSVTKCCIDFYNCLQKKTGVPVYHNTQYKYSSADLLEFRHVRTTDLQKTIQERMMKRAAADSGRPMSPGGKRQRTQQPQQQRPLSPNIDLAMFGQKADDTLSMAHSYMGNVGNQAADPWERVPRIGAGHGQRPQQKPGVIEIVEDSLEILQTQPPDKDGNKSAPPIIQKSLAISVSSQINPSTDVQIVNINDSSSHSTIVTDGPIMSTGRDSITVSPLTVVPGSSVSLSSTSSTLTKDPHKLSYDNQKEVSDRSQFAKKSQPLEQQSSTPQRGLFPVSMSPAASMSPISQINQAKKSFAAGSASQISSMSQSQDSPAMTKRSTGNEMMDRPPSSDSGKDMGAKSKIEDGSASNSTDVAPDLSIVKVEPSIDDPGLDMYVDVPDDAMIQAQHREHDDESDLELEEASGDWSRDEMSNEAGGSDQNNSWYIGQFKAPNKPAFKTKPMPACIKAKKYPGWKEEPSDDPNDQEIEFMPGHKLVHITGHKRACAYCNILRLKTKSGWAIKSYYKCEACDVCLCKGKKDCFIRYHELRMEQPDLSPKMLLKTLKEATANQTPKKARKSAGAKAEDQYAMAGQPGYVNIAPKYEAFTSMMAQSIADQLQAYGGTLDPDDEATESTKQSYITVSPKTPNANGHDNTENGESEHKTPLSEKGRLATQNYETMDPGSQSSEQASTVQHKTTNERKNSQELDDEQLFSQAIDNQQEYLL